ncbi:hypothetical protein [uncultured Sphingomonas sp.]|uniref:hypothetical protein n=1 Tax=uncultured Sphingomonas sp. TaxID=158754 RepID=UPI0025FB77F2|nr:hypothetical protein [uncultured Sphingomonas sp.]
MVKDDDGPVTVGLGYLAIHIGTTAAVAMGVTAMLERYGHLPNWMLAKDSHHRSFVWLIGLSLGLLAQRMLGRVLPQPKRSGQRTSDRP